MRTANANLDTRDVTSSSLDCPADGSVGNPRTTCVGQFAFSAALSGKKRLAFISFETCELRRFTEWVLYQGMMGEQNCVISIESVIYLELHVIEVNSRGRTHRYGQPSKNA